MKSPKIKTPATEKVTPFPDISGVNAQQAKYDALRKLQSRRGRSATILTYGANRKGPGGSQTIAGNLSDIPGGRAGAKVERG